MSDLYFNELVDEAIRNFQKEENLKIKHKIYVEKIKPAIEKLVKYHYYRVPVNRNPDIMHDCMAFVYEQIGKFNSDLYQRGFPYFNQIVKNYFVQQIKLEKKQISNEKYFESLNDDTIEENFVANLDIQEKFEDSEFFALFKNKLQEWKEKTTKKYEKVFLDAIFLLFENAHNIDIYNKKAVSFYIKEITDLNNKQIASNVGKLKRKYLSLQKKYKKGDV